MADTPPTRRVTTEEDQVGGAIGPLRRELRAAHRMAISARIGRPSKAKEDPALSIPQEWASCDGEYPSPIRAAARRGFDHNVNIPAQAGQAFQ